MDLTQSGEREVILPSPLSQSKPSADHFDEICFLFLKTMNTPFANPTILSIGLFVSSLIVIGSRFSIRADKQRLLDGNRQFEEKIEQVRRADSEEIRMISNDFEDWKKEIEEIKSATSRKQMLNFCGSMGMLFFGVGIYYTKRQPRKPMEKLQATDR